MSHRRRGIGVDSIHLGMVYGRFAVEGVGPGIGCPISTIGRCRALSEELVRARVCLVQVAGYLPPDEFWAMLDALDQQIRDSLLEAPVYELVGWSGPAMIGEWAFQQGPRGLRYLGSDDPADPLVIVETADADNPRLALLNLRIRELSTPFDVEGLLAEPPDRLASTTIDGVPVVLEVWEQSDLWWGLGTIRDRTVLIESHGPAPEELVVRQLVELEPYLEERRAMIRRMRNE